MALLHGCCDPRFPFSNTETDTENRQGRRLSWTVGQFNAKSMPFMSSARAAGTRGMGWLGQRITAGSHGPLAGWILIPGVYLYAVSYDPNGKGSGGNRSEASK